MLASCVSSSTPAPDPPVISNSIGGFGSCLTSCEYRYVVYSRGEGKAPSPLPVLIVVRDQANWLPAIQMNSLVCCSALSTAAWPEHVL